MGPHANPTIFIEKGERLEDTILQALPLMRDAMQPDFAPSRLPPCSTRVFSLPSGRLGFTLVPALWRALSIPAGSEIDESKLPPPATAQIDFTRDIRPFWKSLVFRCHGPEKPKSGFRLDNRAAALKGGENGVDILPGNSGQSPLIHYVARLVPDMEMPPEGKGKPLTKDQVGLLRAWIDQGAPWDNPRRRTYLTSLFPPPWAGRGRRRQRQISRALLAAGRIGWWLERFELFDQTDPDTKVLVTGHARVKIITSL